MILNVKVCGAESSCLFLLKSIERAIEENHYEGNCSNRYRADCATIQITYRTAFVYICSVCVLANFCIWLNLRQHNNDSVF